MEKPPSFPFYVQDWLASPTRLQMNMSERGLYWDLLAIAWDSDPPCTIPKSSKIVAKICGVRTQTIRKFHADFTQTFVTYGEDTSDCTTKNCSKFIKKCCNIVKRDRMLERLEPKRPETLLGDTAVAVHPDDPSYRRLIGRTCASRSWSATSASSATTWWTGSSGPARSRSRRPRPGRLRDRHSPRAGVHYRPRRCGADRRNRHPI